MKMTTTTIETSLARNDGAIGDDMARYRGHIYRVLHYTRAFLGDDYDADQVTIDLALAYHDMALWTHRELAYLEPSIDDAEAAAADMGLDVDHDLLRAIIFWHHKFTRYRGPKERIVNAVRRADWCDATAGWIRKGVPRALVKSTVAAIPYEGFHRMLMRVGPELTGGSLLRAMGQMLRVYKV